MYLCTWLSNDLWRAELLLNIEDRRDQMCLFFFCFIYRQRLDVDDKNKQKQHFYVVTIFFAPITRLHQTNRRRHLYSQHLTQKHQRGEKALLKNMHT